MATSRSTTAHELLRMELFLKLIATVLMAILKLNGTYQISMETRQQPCI
jgi:hypothetical protein